MLHSLGNDPAPLLTPRFANRHGRAAGFCYRRDLPRQNAKRFAALSNAGDHQAANAMVIKYGYRYGNQPMIFRDWKVELREQSAGDWLRGRYPLTVRSELTGQVYRTQAQATAAGIECKDKWTIDLPPTI